MKLKGTHYQISVSRDGTCWYLDERSKDGWIKAKDPEIQKCIKSLKSLWCSKYSTAYDKSIVLDLFESYINNGPVFPSSDKVEDEKDKVDQKELVSKVQSLINFFNEFSFKPNFRFLNSFAYECSKSISAGTDYLYNYFEISGNPDASALSDKLKSSEYKELAKSFKRQPKNKINNRLKIYYGDQGTGKTTTALKESDNKCMVCHSAMLPSDLMEDFKFEDGKAVFTPSVLQDAITKGEVITLDEINLLPFESLRFLQSITDGKSEFTYKNKTIKIKDGFKIIGTMNLVVNGCTYPLPEPLVDRCEYIKKFDLTADSLVSAIL